MAQLRCARTFKTGRDSRKLLHFTRHAERIVLLFIDGKLETEEQKQLEIELLKKTRFSGIGVEDQMSFVFLTKVAIMVNESIE